MCVCMCVYAYVCVRVCVHVHVYVHANACVYVHITLRKGLYPESHFPLQTISRSMAEAAAKAAAKRRWLKGLDQIHKDDLHGVMQKPELDDLLPLNGNGQWHIRLTPLYEGADPSDSPDSIEIGIFFNSEKGTAVCIVLTYGDTNMASTLTSENIFFAVSRACSWPNGLKGGSIVIRDGKIEAVGRYIKSPKDAYEINLEGAHVYAGFIESWLETKSYNDKSKTKRRHWDLKVRPDYRSVDNFDLKEKDLKALRSLGFTSAQLAPTQGIFRGQTGIVSLSDSPRAINSSIGQVIDFKYRTKGTRTYPRSLLGVIAHIRPVSYTHLTLPTTPYV